MNHYPNVLSATTMIGDTVKNPKGEDLGDVKELMLDMRTGRVAYAVLSFGGFLGFGDKLFAIPWDALAVDEDDHAFILNINKEKLENAPGFDKDNWPNSAAYEAGWLNEVYDYYGYTPYWN